MGHGGGGGEEGGRARGGGVGGASRVVQHAAHRAGGRRGFGVVGHPLARPLPLVTQVSLFTTPLLHSPSPPPTLTPHPPPPSGAGPPRAGLVHVWGGQGHHPEHRGHAAQRWVPGRARAWAAKWRAVAASLATLTSPSHHHAVLTSVHSYPCASVQARPLPCLRLMQAACPTTLPHPPFCAAREAVRKYDEVVDAYRRHVYRLRWVLPGRKREALRQRTGKQAGHAVLRADGRLHPSQPTTNRTGCALAPTTLAGAPSWGEAPPTAAACCTRTFRCWRGGGDGRSRAGEGARKGLLAGSVVATCAVPLQPASDAAHQPTQPPRTLPTWWLPAWWTVAARPRLGRWACWRATCMLWPTRRGWACGCP